MARNLVTKKFGNNGTWVCPAGVTAVSIFLKKRPSFLERSNFYGSATMQFVDRFGNAFAWGSNPQGIIGDNTVAAKSSPTLVVGGLRFSKVIATSSGNQSAFGIHADTGNLYAWGLNTNGQLGTNDVTHRSSPTLVVGGLKFLDVQTASNLAFGGTSAFGISTNGNLYAWGANSIGQLGVNDTTPRSSPTLVVGGLKWRSVLSRTDGAMAMAADGNLYAWGSNGSGNLGDGTTLNRSSPTLVVGGLSIKKWDVVDDSTAYRAAIITTSNDMYTWGDNADGQLGLNDTANRSSPTLVVGGLKWKDMAVGSAAGFGITYSNQLYAWGSNGFGHLGVNDTTPRSSPTLVVGGLSVAKVAYNNPSAFTLILATNGTVYSCGLNGQGQLGLGDTTSRSSPVAVAGSGSFIDVYALGSGRAAAIGNDGYLWMWGINTAGQLGVGDTTPRSSPVAVIGNNMLSLDGSAITKTVPVTPGQTYNIKLAQVNVIFGTEKIASGVFDEMILQYMA